MSVTAAMAVEIGMITVRDLTGDASKRDPATNRQVPDGVRPPLPSELIAVLLVFGGLDLISRNGAASGPANLIAWGLVLATLYATFEHEKKIPVLGAVASFMGGGDASPTAVATGSAASIAAAGAAAHG